MSRFFVFLLTVCIVHSNGLYGTFLVRMKVDQSPRAAGASSINELNFIRDRGLQNLKKLEAILKLDADEDPRKLSGPRSVGSPKVKHYERYWFINSARLIMRVDLANELRKSAAVAEVVSDEPVFVDQILLGQKEYSTELSDLGLPEIQELDLLGQGIRIGIIDTGLFKHKEFDNKVISYKDFTESPSHEMRDELGHGSHVAGLLVGGNYSGSQIGIAPKSKLIVAKVIEPISAEGGKSIVQKRLKTFASRVLAAMQWMLDPDGDPKTLDYPHVINNSWSFPVAAPISKNFFDRALARWRELGIIPVFAAGNEGLQGANTISYPANSFQVITIGATRKNQRAPFSSIGSQLSRKPDFMLPGYRLLSLKKGISGPVYGRMSGTSMSAPLASGLIAVLKQIDPFIGFSEVYRILESSAKDMGDRGWDSETGWGKVNFLDAVRVARTYISDKISHGGKDTFKYYRHFANRFDDTRDEYYRDKMIELELSYMNFLERHLGSNESIVLRRWLKYLSELVGREPEIFSDLNLRVIKRLKFLHIHSQSD